MTNSGLEATATTSVAHGYSNNDVVTIDGALVNTSLDNPFNGTFLIYSVTSTTFKYLMNNLPGGSQSGGTMTASKALVSGSYLFRFDAILDTLGPNTRIHLGPTTSNRPFLTKGFKVEGALGLNVKPAMKIVGSGIDVTTLRLVGQNGTCYAIGHDFAAGALDYFEISDLSIAATRWSLRDWGIPRAAPCV